MEHSRAIKHRNLLFAALGDLLRRRMRSVVVALSLTAILFPLVTALAISEGLRFQAEIAVRAGADFFVSTDLYGGSGAISVAFLEELSALKGVTHATARVVGRTYFANRLVAVIGIDRESLLTLKPLVRGTLPDARGEVLVGRSVADEFAVEPGIRFTLALNNKKVFKSVGTISPTCLWGSDVLIMHLEDANEFFRIKGDASQLLLYTSPKDVSVVKKSLSDLGKLKETPWSQVQIQDRAHIEQRLGSGYGYKGGIFVVLFVIGTALAVSAFLVTSGFGLKELDKEIGLLKAVGWRTWEVLEKVVIENLLISLTAVSLSVLLSMVWIKGLNGILIAQFYVAEVGLIPNVDIPSRYLPSHAVFYLLFALVVTLIGSLFSTWRKARITPTELMR
ncbi:MAG: FtsX-like permease family protein [Desulfobacteraceae bacterium]